MMEKNYEQRSQKAYDLAVDVIANAVVLIINLQIKIIKHLSILGWKVIKFTAWSMTKRNFWKGLLFSVPTTAFCIVLGLYLFSTKHYVGTYFGYKSQLLEAKEMQIKKLQDEVIEKQKELEKWESLKNGDYEAVKIEVQRVFKQNWKVMFATIQAENAPRNGKFNCKVVQDWMNKDGSVDYGLGQVNSVHLWMVDNQPEKLLDCKTNIAVLYRIWDRADGVEGDGKGKPTPWVAYNDGRANQFLSSL